MTTATTPSQGLDLLEGVYQTPLNLLEPINRRWQLTFDLAAHLTNAVPGRLGKDKRAFYGESQNSLNLSWENWDKDFAWCNPPYGDIGAWTRKAEAEAAKGARIVMLLPSATGATWLTDHCLHAKIVFLIGRPVFEFINPITHKNPAKAGKPNTDPYGKDMLLVVYDGTRGVEWWNWRK